MTEHTLPEFEEEEWEHEIARLLGSLPEVEPPPGFLEAAIDRRPLHAGRVAVGALSLSAMALVGVAVFGLVGPGRAEFSLDWLTSRHATVAAGMRSSSSTSAAVSLDALLAGDPSVVVADQPSDDPLDLPSEFEHEADLVTEDLRQAVYSHGSDAVSVFEQPGRADFDALGVEGIRDFDGVDAWVDERRELMIVETTDAVVAVVGLQPDEMAAVLADARPRREGTFDATVGALMAELGFPE
ncbi:MAG: hypothetical protein R2733_07250 [Acidimicrobiales bacterium]